MHAQRAIKQDRVRKAEGPVVVEESWANLDKMRAEVMEQYIKLKLPSKDDRDVSSP